MCRCSNERCAMVSPSFVAWMSLPMVRLGEAYHVDGMDEFHGSNIEVHLVFLEDTLGTPSLKGEFSRVPLCVLSDLVAIRPQESLDSVGIVLVGWDRHGLDDRIELDPGVGLLWHLLAAMVFQGNFLGLCVENVLLVLCSLEICLGGMIDAEIPYQSVSDLIVCLYPHCTVFDGMLWKISVVALGDHVLDFYENYVGIGVLPMCFAIGDYLFYDTDRLSPYSMATITISIRLLQ